jgi:hypothetical protein
MVMTPQRSSLGSCCGAAQYGFDAADQLHHTEGLDDIVVRAFIQAAHLT